MRRRRIRYRLTCPGYWWAASARRWVHGSELDGEIGVSSARDGICTMRRAMLAAAGMPRGSVGILERDFTRHGRISRVKSWIVRQDGRRPTDADVAGVEARR